MFSLYANASATERRSHNKSVSIDTITNEEDYTGFQEEKARRLKEVVVKPKRAKYSKKNNPAVDLMQKVRASHKQADPEESPIYNYDRYEKMLIGFNEFEGGLSQSKGRFDREARVFADLVDTAAWTGKRILALSLKEKYSRVLDGKDRKSKMEVIKGIRSKGLDEGFNQDNIRNVLEDVFREIDIYGNDITLMQNRFVSPLSAIAADYYKYEITDTVMVGGEKCIELSFSPHSPESFSFNGRLYIPVEDSRKYVKRISMRVPKAINLNYVDNIFVSQNFFIDSIGMVHKELDDMCLEMQAVKGTPKFYINRQLRFRNFSYDKDPEFEKFSSEKGEEVLLTDAASRDKDYWLEARLIPLSKAESNLDHLMVNFRSMPLFYWGEKILKVLVNGYVPTWNPSKFDIGPVNTFISHNTAEGFRFRAGGVTTPALSKRIFARGYIAYGLRDHKIKYSGELEYSFIDKKYNSREFPVNSIRATYQYDRDQIGQHYLFTNADNVFLSLRRMRSDLITYKRLARLEYNLELRNNLSFGIQLSREQQEATPRVTFRNADGSFDRRYTQSSVKFTIRYAPGEKFVQGATVRRPINMDAPVFMLTHEFGPKGTLGSDFTINKTEFYAQKRFWFSSFGYTDVVFKAGKIWSQVEFPALLWQNANISYTIQPESYTLLNPMEFAMDQFASLDLSYFGNGILFNRIPLIKKLKLREIVTFKGFLGKLSDKNNPEFNDRIYRFPLDSRTTAIGRKPYMEVGVGIDNILTILRVDYVWRLTYRDMPGIDRSGVRISLHFSF